MRQWHRLRRGDGLRHDRCRHGTHRRWRAGRNVRLYVGHRRCGNTRITHPLLLLGRHIAQSRRGNAAILKLPHPPRVIFPRLVLLLLLLILPVVARPVALAAITRPTLIGGLDSNRRIADGRRNRRKHGGCRQGRRQIGQSGRFAAEIALTRGDGCCWRRLAAAEVLIRQVDRRVCPGRGLTRTIAISAIIVAVAMTPAGIVFPHIVVDRPAATIVMGVARRIDDADVAIAPIPTAPAPKRTDRDIAVVNSGRIGVAHRWWNVGRGIIGIGPRAVGIGRVIERHVNNVGIGRCDRDLVVLHRHLAARIGVQFVGITGFTAQALHGIHHVGLLRQEGITQLGEPIEVAIHHFQNLRKSRQRFDARIPIVIFKRGNKRIAFQSFVFGTGRPAGRFDHLQRIGRRHENLGQQLIRIKCNRCQKRI